MEHTRQEMEMLSRLAKGAYKTHNISVAATGKEEFTGLLLEC